MPPIYPFDPSGDVVDKLTFVHDRVAASPTRPLQPGKDPMAPKSNPHPVGTME